MTVEEYNSGRFMVVAEFANYEVTLELALMVALLLTAAGLMIYIAVKTIKLLKTKIGRNGRQYRDKGENTGG